MRGALIRGRDHPALGEIESLAGRSTALALSAGGAPKTYTHTDPNEDAACSAEGEGGALAAVADAHSGCEASELALERVLARHAAPWTAAEAVLDEARWRELAHEALLDVHYAVLRGTMESPHRHSRSTLALAVARPAEGLLLFASVGDSHVFRVGSTGDADPLAPKGHCDARFFLGSASLTPAELRQHAVVGAAPVADARALVLATDGLSEEGLGVEDPAAAVRRAADAGRAAGGQGPALATARTLLEEALASHRQRRAGDNVATAALWLE